MRVRTVDVECSGGELTIERNKPIHLMECPCTEGRIFATQLDIETLESEIHFRIDEALALNEGGSQSAFQTSTSRILQYDCANCGRQLSATVKFTLAADVWGAIQKGWAESSLASLYLGLIQVSTETRGGYVRHPQNIDDARDLLTVFCRCFTANPLPEPTKYFNELCDAMRSNSAEFLGRTPLEPKVFTQKIRCKKCLQTITVETTISVKMPTTPAEIIRLNNIWSPYVAGQPFVFGNPKIGVWSPKGTGAT